MSARLPALFAGHGSPANALDSGEYSAALREFASTFPKPQAAVVISSHWVTPGTRVSSASRPRQLYDFFGLPEALYEFRYHARGDEAVADLAAELLSLAGLRGVATDPARGIDHAAWAVMAHLYPDASVPVVEVSLDYRNPAESMFELGAALAALRDRGVLPIGSGNISHNLAALENAADAPAHPWAVKFDELFAGCAERSDRGTLARYASHTEESAMAVPTPEHYLPALAVLGMRRPGDRLRTLYRGFQNGCVSMRCFALEAGA